MSGQGAAGLNIGAVLSLQNAASGGESSEHGSALDVIGKPLVPQVTNTVTGNLEATSQALVSTFTTEATGASTMLGKGSEKNTFTGLPKAIIGDQKQVEFMDPEQFYAAGMQGFGTGIDDMGHAGLEEIGASMEGATADLGGNDAMMGPSVPLEYSMGPPDQSPGMDRGQDMGAAVGG